MNPIDPLIPINPLDPEKKARLPVARANDNPTAESAWHGLTEKKRDVAMRRLLLVKAVLAKEEDGLSMSAGVNYVLKSIRLARATQILITAAVSLGRKKNAPPSRGIVINWMNAYKESGPAGLAPKHRGSQRREYGWEARAIYLYNLPSKPDMAAVARWIREEGEETATESRVHRYIKSLPADVREGRSRLGPRLFANTKKGYVRRNTEMLPVGHLWQGDGHTLDLYLQHPTGSKVWRAELTAWMDIRSRYVPGFWIDENESALSTLFALGDAITRHDHIPAMLHIDNGSGYKNRMLSDKHTGFYERMGISIMHSRPYNAKGKGQIERWFKTLECDFNKRFVSYCGKDMSEEAIQKLLKQYAKGEITLPTKDQYIRALTVWIEIYNNTPHDSLDGKTPAQVWAGLERCPVEPKGAALFLPQKRRTVRRESIRIDNREYRNPELIAYDKQKLIVEFSIHDDAEVRVLDEQGCWICDATLVHKADYIPVSRIDEGSIKRAKKAVERLEKHADEKRRRAGLLVDHTETLNDLALMNEEISLLEKREASPLQPASLIEPEGELVIDPLTTDY